MKKNIIVLIITVLFVSCGTATEAKSASYTENVNAAKNFFLKGNYKYAASRYKRAVFMRPDSLNAHAKWIAWASMKSAAIDTALAYFDIALAADNTNADIIAGQAFALSIKAKVLSQTNRNLMLEESMYKADQLIYDSEAWTFAYNINLSENHLYLLQAQNYFSVADFYESEDYAYDLSSILVDAEFVTDSVRDLYFDYPSLNSQEGQAGLALSIEWLLSQL